MEYEVVREECLPDMVDEVRKLISKGFKPLGGVCVVYASSKMFFYQAMVKLDEL